MNDSAIFTLIEEERQRQLKGIELIASENFVSEEVMKAMGSCMTNKYAEGYPGKRYYGGCEVVDKSEQLAIDRVKQLFGAEWANVQPHSGAQAKYGRSPRLSQPWRYLYGAEPRPWWHLSHGSAVNSSGLLYHAIDYMSAKKRSRRLRSDGAACSRAQAQAHHRRGAQLTLANGTTSVSVRSQIRSGAIFLVDMAHPAGLIAAGLLDNPVKFAHIVTSTTHKTLRGPRGGIILMGKDFDNPWGKTTPKGEIKKMSALLDSAVFPGVQGGPLEHVIAAKAVAFYEALQPSFKEYGRQVKKNAQAMAEAFVRRGYGVVSGGTDNHCMLIDLRGKFPELTGKVAEKALVAADITVNKNMVPFDSRSAFQTSGIRVGTPAITTRGVKEDKMEYIVSLIDRVLSAPEDEAVIAAVRKEVNEMMANYPIFAW